MTDTATETLPPAPSAAARHLRKSRIGEVTATKMQKTVVVETVSRVPHAKFGKIVKQIKKFYVHDEAGQGPSRRCRPHQRDAPSFKA